ncbi:MAG TPA: DNA phosphorothioation-associated putative methyltransferase [Devosia sp.]|jgi:DNA phosphorothioation-associated putative methyltransferase|nr:DNA phosphorothioation-associated putative methyltransferase [Devosia sp.]
MDVLDSGTEADLMALHRVAIRRVEGGKRVAESLYLHSSLLGEQAPEAQRLVEAARHAAQIGPDDFNVVRFSLRKPEVALLSYPTFFEDAFPAVRRSWLVDLSIGRVSESDFSAQDNPAILHRKEALLPEDHPRRAEFRSLTEALEDYGAFDRPLHLIGRRSFWEETLAELGLRVEDHRLLAPGGVSPAKGEAGPLEPTVARHRTAISRSRLSTPMQALARWDFFDGTPSVLDYGCGRGDDVRALAAAGVPARGWDPHFATDTPLEPADVVNLGFVLNVIEKPEERAEALRRAFSLTRRVLAVAVMLAGKGGGSEHGDGVLTSRGTFQRYYTQAELREYVARVLGREPVNVGPGVVFAFRSDEEEQAFLARRQRSAVVQTDRFYVAPLSVRERVAKPTVYERHQDLLDEFWAVALELGRLPEPGEFRREGELREALPSLRRAFSSLPYTDKEEELRRVAERRTDDLLVYMALNVFERRRSFQALPLGVQRDVRVFFGSYKTGLECAKLALFEAGDREKTVAHGASAAAAGLGVLDPEDNDYTFRAATLPQQPPTIRIIVGCAERLEPMNSDVDFLKIHGSGDRVSYLAFDGIETRALPLLSRRTVVDLRRQRVADVPGETRDGQRVLLGKAAFMEVGAAGREQQQRFDEELRRKLNSVKVGIGPGHRALARMLAAAGVVTRRATASTQVQAGRGNANR